MRSCVGAWHGLNPPRCPQLLVGTTGPPSGCTSQWPYPFPCWKTCLLGTGFSVMGLPLSSSDQKALSVPGLSLRSDSSAGTNSERATDA